MRYVRSHHQRMRYREARDAGAPMGSDPKEAANTMIISTRLKRSGQRWGRAGGQGRLMIRRKQQIRNQSWSKPRHMGITPEGATMLESPAGC